MRIDNAGVALEVDEGGTPDGPPVLLLHGLGSSAATYDFLLSELPDHRLLRLDFRGHGRSDRAPGRYLVGDYTSDAVVALTELVGGPVPVVGHSLGGVVAAHLAMSHTELVSAVFLEDPPLFFGDRSVFERTPFAVLFPLLRTAIDRWQAEALPPERIAAQLRDTPSMSGQGTMGEEQLPDAIAAFAEAFALLDTTVYDAVVDGTSLAGFDPVAPIRVPGIVLRPDQELGAAFLAEQADVVRAASPWLDVVHVAGVGHLIHDSRRHRAEYVRHLRAFLDRHAPT